MRFLIRRRVRLDCLVPHFAMDVSDPFNRHGLHFFDVVRPRFSFQISCFGVTLFVSFEQKTCLVKWFWRVFRNLLGFGDFQRAYFSLSILYLELVLFELLMSLINCFPRVKTGKDPESALKFEAHGCFFWIRWADKSDHNFYSFSVISRKEEWLL